MSALLTDKPRPYIIWLINKKINSICSYEFYNLIVLKNTLRLSVRGLFNVLYDHILMCNFLEIMKEAGDIFKDTVSARTVHPINMNYLLCLHSF